jgi:protein-disulfide isomerase
MSAALAHSDLDTGRVNMAGAATASRLLVSVTRLWLLVMLLVPGQLRAEEPRVTREALVMAVERGPGPAKGRAEAPITIVEFSDFRCSYCRKFWKETLPRIELEYVRTGKVRFVYRHLAALGPPSMRAAEAAECAAEQGRFWGYHDLLFERAPSVTFTDDGLKEYAKELGLDSARFGACLASGRHSDRIQRESAAARYLGASGTPTFLVNGQLLIGAHPFETFRRVLDAELSRSGTVPERTVDPAKPPARR